MPQINGVVVDDDGCVDTPEGKKAHVAALHLIPKAQHEAEMALSAKLAPARAAKAALAATDALMSRHDEQFWLDRAEAGKVTPPPRQAELDQKQAARDAYNAALALLSKEERGLV